MNLLQQFVNYLLNQRPKPSLSTIKNYKADVGQFISWFEKEFNSYFDPAKVTRQMLQKYKQARSLSGSSMERHTSSLHKFFSFLKLEGIIFQDPLEKRTVSAEAQAKADPWMLRNFKNFLYEYKKSNLTIKNYINDIKSFFSWLEEAALVKYSWNVADKNLLNKINFSVIQEYKQRLITAKFSPATINRKLSSLRNYIGWAKGQGFIPLDHTSSHAELVSISRPEQITNEVPNRAEDTYSSFPPTRLIEKSLKGINFLFDNIFILSLVQAIEVTQNLFWRATGKNIFKKNVIHKSARKFQPEEISNIKREFYAPLSVSTRYLPIQQRLWHYLRHVRPNWYKRYHSYSFTHYFHFAILMILSCAVGFGIYNNFFADTPRNNGVLGAFTNSPPRILSFQGKLTDSFGAPVTKEATVLFSLYDDGNASSAVALWQEQDNVKPDSNGAFSVFLGKKTLLPDTIFNQNSRLFLGIAVGDSPELQPRQELATASFAANSNTLQGLEPITNSSNTNNVVLALDSSGNLSIADAKTHVFQAIGGNLILSGKVLSLTTALGSNSNIEIVPDGLGKIDLSKPIQNSTNNNNVAAAIGSVEFDDNVAILATTSAQSAFYINQNSTGTLISANTNESAKFTVGNDGTGMFAGGLGINGGNLTSTATTFNLLNSNVTTLNLGGAATTLNLGVSGGNTTIKSNLILSSLSSNGGILYTNGSGKILQASAGSSSDCLTGGSTPSFTACSGANLFNQANGTIYASNNTMDVLFGGSSSSSAKMAFININSGTPTASISGDLTLNSAGIIRTTNRQTLTLGDTSTGNIVFGNNGNVGIGTTNPSYKLDVSGDINYMGTLYNNGVVADFAEYFKKEQGTSIPFGSIVCLNNQGLTVACDNNNNKIIGVTSEHPAFLGGENLGNGSIAVGLVGQIETLVATINGEIKAGDTLTGSDIPGVAVKTTKAGQIIGKALEDLTTTDETKVAGFYDPDNKEYRSKADFPNIPLKPNIIRVFKILTSVNVSWHDPSAYLAQNGDLIINSTGSNEYSISNSKNETLTNIGGFFAVVAAKIQAGLINASKIVTDSLIVTSDSLIVNGQNLKDYIVQTVKEAGIKNQESSIISPVVNTDQLATNIISPLSSSSLIVKLSTPSGALIVQNASGSAIASIDSTGKINANEISVNQASISGNLNAGDASISGTLRAGNIIADSITGLEAKISSYVSLASYSAQLSNIPDFTAERGQFNQGLMVFGPTSLSDLALAGRFSIGATMFITENSIETLGTDLSLQSLRLGGLSIMGGLVKIDTQGNVKIQGSLAINNTSGLSVLSVSQTGDLVASGSGTFAKLNFSLVQPVLAVSDTEVIASSSAGIANIAPYQSELTIRDALVTDKSVIYITPVGTPSAQTPFLMRQVPNDSFTVGVQSPTNHPLDFNWLIIN